MAVDAAPARNARPGPSLTLVRGRGRPDMVTIRRTALMAGLLEGIALADEAIDAANVIHHGAAVGSRQLVVNRAGELGSRALKARNEFRRLAAEVEE